MTAAAPSLRGLRVCVVLEAPEVGGAERQGLLLARYLADREGCAVEVWTILEGTGSLGEEARATGIPFRELRWAIPPGFPARAGLILELARLLREARVDVVLPFTTMPNMFCGLAFRLAGARASIWNERIGAPDEIATFAQRLAAALTPVFIANSRLGAACLPRIYGVRPDRIRLVYNGLALAPALEGRAAWRARLGVGPAALVATMVANVHGRKDHATLVRAFHAATASRPAGEAVLVCAGGVGSPAHAAVVALARELGVGDRVLFPGRVADVAGLLEASDLAVFSSHLEGTPNGVLESMASGLPVVATDLPGIRDVLGEGADHWLVPPGDAARFGERIAELLADPALRAEVGRHNRAIIEAKFTAAAMGEGTATVIRGALHGWGPLRLPRLPRPLFAPRSEPTRSHRP